MKFYQLLLLLSLLCICSSCTQEESTQDIRHDQLIGHWDISVPSGLQFIEFISDTEVLIGDRGAIGEVDISQHYYQEYNLSNTNQIVNLPSGSMMTNLNFEHGRFTFDFINPTTGHERKYYAFKASEKAHQSTQSELLNQTWITIEENGEVIDEENQKLAYFSKAGIYFLKDLTTEDIIIYNWEWNEALDEVCYTPYQRPMFIPQVTCLEFLDLREGRAVFEVQGNYIIMVPLKG